jgi:hypothetical protein
LVSQNPASAESTADLSSHQKHNRLRPGSQALNRSPHRRGEHDLQAETTEWGSVDPIVTKSLVNHIRENIEYQSAFCLILV